MRILFNTLNEIGRENNKNLDEIKKEFFDDLKSYDEIIRSRKERDRLQSEVKNLEIQTIKEREKYNSYPQIIQSIDRLSNAGIYEDDILEIEKIISMTGIQLYKDKPIYKQNLMDDLRKYGNLKLAIKNLKDRIIYLKPKKKIRSKQRNNHHHSISKMNQRKQILIN